jgi:alpha-L-rhamnosidase
VEGTPLFGWLLPDAGNELQSAYQILVTRVADEMVVWDSDKVVSAQQSYVSYAGPALASQTSYAWQVRTWNRSDQVSPWSAPALFDTGLSDQDWDASWIRRASSDADDYTLARAELTVTASPVTRARAYLAASHQAELYLNGVLVDRGSAFAYPGEGYYQATDVTAHVKAGEVLALGAIYRWYGSGQGRPAGERGLLVRLVVDHADGTEQVLVTDGKWRVKRASAWQTGTPKRNGTSNASTHARRHRAGTCPATTPAAGPRPTWSARIRPRPSRTCKRERVAPLAARWRPNPSRRYPMARLWPTSARSSRRGPWSTSRAGRRDASSISSPATAC